MFALRRCGVVEILGLTPFRFSVAVSDIGAVKAHLQSLGIDTSEASSGAKVKTVMITDPDGNHLAFAEAIDPTMAR